MDINSSKMEYEGTAHYTPSAVSRRKRLKVASACAPCRRRKVKCDSARPVCNTCEKTSMVAECTYPKRANDDMETPVEPAEPSSFHKVPGCQRSFLANSPRVKSPSTEPYNADAMHGATGDPTLTREVFGSSSAGSFMRQIQAVIDARLDTSQSTREHLLSGQSGYPSYEEPSLFLLPARGLANSLMQAYWDHDWTLYPIINRREVEAAYESLWTSKSTRNYPLNLLSIINLGLALGCHYCEALPPKERRSTGDSFFGRAERLYKRLADRPSCERVQYLLLSGLYLQSTSKAFQCWMTVGQAIRMAQSLGIHTSQSASSPESVSDREYKRRIWHGCIWLDRVVSSTLGRPGMIPKWLFNSVPFPSMIDDEFFETQSEGSIIRPDGRPCVMAFFVKTMELYQVLDDILVNLYLTPSRDEEVESKLTHMLEIDRKMQAWNKSLPHHLRSHTAAKGDPILERQAIEVRVRFLHIRVLLFRPALVRYCMRGSPASIGKLHYTNDSSLSDVLLSESSDMCLRSAHELVEIFNHHLDPDTLTGPLPNWWYSILYVYTSTTIVLLERFLEINEGGGTRKSTAYNTWHAALRVLKAYSALADSSRTCVATLEVLAHKLSLDDSNNTKRSASTTSSQNGAAQNWDSFWGISDLFSEGSENLDPGFFPFSFDDSNWMDLMPGPYNNGHIPQPPAA